jgi:serine/threonine protein phosphatase PrpC
MDMGTTLAALEIRGNKGRLLSVGDVLTFHFRDGMLTLLNFPDWATEDGRPLDKAISGLSVWQPPFPQDDAEIIISYHPDSYLRHALGYPIPRSVPIREFEFEKGDRLLVATDGFYNAFLSLELMRRIVVDKGKSLEDIAEKLKYEALPRAYDHVTFVLAEA